MYCYDVVSDVLLKYEVTALGRQLGDKKSDQKVLENRFLAKIYKKFLSVPKQDEPTLRCGCRLAMSSTESQNYDNLR